MTTNHPFQWEPSDRALSVEVTPYPAGVLVRLHGSATMERCDELTARLADAAQGRPALMVLDLGDLDFICSLGLGSIVAVYLRAMKYGGRVVVSRPAQAIREMLELTRLSHLLTVYDTPEAALAGRA